MMVQVTITPNGRMSLLAEIRKRLGLVGGRQMMCGLMARCAVATEPCVSGRWVHQLKRSEPMTVRAAP